MVLGTSSELGITAGFKTLAELIFVLPLASIPCELQKVL